MAEKQSSALVGIALGAACATVGANPQGPHVVHGSAAFAHPDPATLRVTNSPNAIIHWRGFSIGAGETTRFVQESAASAVLNRVTGPDPSGILGRLLSNGRVFLVNPHGIVFGPNATVDTAGLVASTLGISDEDFLAGRYEFEAGPEAGDIVNEGLVRTAPGGEVFLIAPSVENSGVIETDGGDLVLAAGRKITLTSLDLDGIRVEVQAPEDEVLNLGALIANGGAAGVFAGSIRQEGTIEANAVTVDEAGRVTLVATGDVGLAPGSRTTASGPAGGTVHVESREGTTLVEGAVEATGRTAAGGEVRLLGQRVGILEEASVDVSGETGGGTALVGGDVRGEGDVPSAEATFVAGTATIRADAGEAGDGGTVVVWSNGPTRTYGSISARGGERGGVGGFVETSGAAFLDVGAAVPDVGAPAGAGGTWLLDPHDVEIIVGSGTLDDQSPDFSPGADDSTINVAVIETALNAAQNVTIDTGSTGTQAGDITVNAPITKSGSTFTAGLSFDAAGDLIVNQPITATIGDIDLNVVVGNQAQVNADIDLAGGEFFMIKGDAFFNPGVSVSSGRFEIAVGGDDASVTVDGATWNDQGAPSTSFLGSNAGSSGTLTLVNNAVLNTSQISIGSPPGSSGTMDVNASTWTAIDNVDVGNEGTGTLTVQGGGSVDWTGGFNTIANFGSASGTVTVTGTGSVLDLNGGSLTVANGQVATLAEDGFDAGTPGPTSGTLNVLAGASVTGVNLTVGSSFDLDGGTTEGTVLVDGAGSSLVANPGSFTTIGDGAGSQGSLTVSNGATWDTGGVGIGSGPGGVGTVLVDGGSWTATGGVDVGAEGTGTLTVEGSSTVDWSGSFNSVANAGSSSGSMTVSGAGTVVDLNGGPLNVANGSVFTLAEDGFDFGTPGVTTATLTVSSGARVVGLRRMTIGNGFNLDGGQTDGTVTITGVGTMVETVPVVVAGVVDSGTVRVGSDGGVAGRGKGTLTVSAGATLNAFSLDVGRSGEDNTATITGTGTTVTLSPDFGGFGGDFQNEAGFLRAARNAGNVGTIRVENGAVVRVLDDGGTNWNPQLGIARNKGSEGTVIVDGAGSRIEIVQTGPANFSDPALFPGPTLQLRRGGGTLIVRNGGEVLVDGEEALVRVSRDSVSSVNPEPDTGPIDQQSVVTVETGGQLRIQGTGARLEIGAKGPAADGVVSVSGDGSLLEVSGTASGFSGIFVGDEGKGTLDVFAGATLNAFNLHVGRSALDNTMTVTGAGTLVNLSPDFGSFGGDFANEAAFLRVARDAGHTGTLTIADGALVRVADGQGKFGPEVQIARNKGSVGTIEVEGAGSLLEIVQAAPADFSDPNVFAGPALQAGRRGGGTLLIRDGGEVRIAGEAAFMRVSRDSVFAGNPDPDTGPIDQQSVVTIESGGTLDIEGTGALLAIGDAGPAADGVVTVTGAGSVLEVSGLDSSLLVGRVGKGTLDVSAGATVNAFNLQVGRSALDNTMTVTGAGTLVNLSPDFGSFGGDFVNAAAFLRVARDAGHTGTLTIADGALVRVADGQGKFGPEVQIARNKGSVGTIEVEGAGSLLEVVQAAPADFSDPNVFAGPALQAGRRGGGTLLIRDGGEVRLAGEAPFMRVSRDSVFAGSPDPDTGPIDQQSVVTIESGGQLVLDGSSAFLAIGDGGPAADGMVSVSGIGSKITVSGFNSAINVGDDGRGTLLVENGAIVDPAFLSVGRHPGSTGTVTVTGAGSRIALSGSGTSPDLPGTFAPFMNVGFEGSGSVLVLDGAEIAIEGGALPFPGFSVGRSAGGAGLLTVSGTGSRVTVTSDLVDRAAGDGTALVQIGRAGAGTVLVENGGTILNGPGGLTVVGRDAGSAGDLEVTGSGSVLEAGSLLLVGLDFDFDTLVSSEPGGSGEARAIDGGVIRTASLAVGAGDTASGITTPPPPEEPPVEVPEEEEASQEGARETTNAVLTTQETSAEDAARATVDEEDADVDEGDEDVAEEDEAEKVAEGEDEEDGEDEDEEDEAEKVAEGEDEDSEEKPEELKLCS